MRRASIILVLTGTIVLSGCGGDLLAPYKVVGRYMLQSFDETSVSPAAPQTPFLGGASIIDSVRDTVVLASDGTYRENGGIWGHGSAVLFQAHGTYTVKNAAITFIQTTGVTVTGGGGSIVGDTLTVMRYPGRWVWVKE